MYIAILSRGPQLYSTQSLFRAALRRKHKVRVIDHMRCEMAIEDNQPVLTYMGGKFPKLDAVIPRIGSSVNFYGCSIVRHLEQMNYYCAVSSNAIIQSRDKLRSLQLLASQGIGIPNTLYPHDTQDPYELITRLGGPPVVIKLLEGTHGAGVVLAESMNAAVSIMEAFNRMKQRYILQEYIAEAKGADVRLLVVDGEVVAAMKRRAKPGDFRSNLHRGGSAIHVVPTSKEIETALKATEILGLKVAGVDLLESEKGPLLLEVNPSPGLEGIEKTTRVDIAGKIIEYLERAVEEKQQRVQQQTI